jgi:hypothetical protein
MMGCAAAAVSPHIARITTMQCLTVFMGQIPGLDSAASKSYCVQLSFFGICLAG